MGSIKHICCLPYEFIWDRKRWCMWEYVAIISKVVNNSKYCCYYHSNIGFNTKGLKKKIWGENHSSENEKQRAESRKRMVRKMNKWRGVRRKGKGCKRGKRCAVARLSMAPGPDWAPDDQEHWPCCPTKLGAAGGILLSQQRSPALWSWRWVA